MTLTAKEIEAKIEAFEQDGHEFSWYDWKWETGFDAVDVPDLGKVWVVDTFGGGEGSGEEMYIIFRVLETGERPYRARYFQKDGYYASFDGSNWDGAFFEVRPTQINATIYEKVGK
ncbi:hypothetical protein ACFXG4_23530 [Nocardia sp. NPDC059246]|uniref:hypothetical protein n=1 Tax=unclassified Nocardia TaxID=2637762 RepID=UPI0036D1C0B3